MKLINSAVVQTLVLFLSALLFTGPAEGNIIKIFKTEPQKIPASARNSGGRAIEQINSAIKISEHAGDGAYFVGSGDTVTLNNNIKVKINHIAKITPSNQFTKNELDLYLSFYLGETKLTPLPMRVKISSIPQNDGWLGYSFSGYAAVISIPTANQEAELETISAPLKKYKLLFSSSSKIGTISSASQLYERCIADLPEQYNKSQCFIYTPYTPLQNEQQKSDEEISVIGPANLVEPFFNAAKKCHAIIESAVGVNAAAPQVPIRIVNGLTTAVSSPTLGILVPQSMNISPDQSCNTIMLHEMAHFTISPAPIRNIFNEGFATYVTSLKPQIDVLTLKSADFEIDTNWKMLPQAGAPVGIKLKAIDTQNGSVTLDYGMQIAGNWQSMQNTELKLFAGEAIVIYYDPYFPVIELQSADLDSAKLRIYEHLSPAKNSSTMICEDNGFREMLGWKNQDGEIVKAAGAINPLLPFAKLDTYLNGGTASSEEFYKTAACFWESIDNAVGIKKVIAEMRKWQNYNNEPFDLMNFLSLNGMNIDEILQTFGLSPDGQAQNAYPLFITGEYLTI